MKKYFLLYDLCNPGKNYAALYEIVHQFDCMKICDSAWAIKTNFSAQQVCDKFSSVIDSNDIFFVAEYSGNGFAFNLSPSVINWLNT